MHTSKSLSMAESVYIIIVTHDSSDVLSTCLARLDRQTFPITSIIVVDSGSADTHYLQDLEQRENLKLVLIDNVGFAKANNFGFREIPDQEGVVLVINPDTFLPDDYISQAIEILTENSSAAIVSGKLLGFDNKLGKPTGKIDSTGIFRKWYGRWYDRGIGEDDSDKYCLVEKITAVCGALMVCRLAAFYRYNGEIFDADFFLYKEDIELSIRLRRDGWQLIYDPRLIAYHCRGWQKKRTKIPFALRAMAAKNEVMLYKKHPSPYILWAFLKYILVVVFKV